MRTRMILLVLLASGFLNANAQSYQTVEEVNDVCGQLGFMSDEDALLAVDKIMEQIGMRRNFVLHECPNINNAIAKNIRNSSGLLERYILYDPNFFDSMEERAGTHWASTSILAHEIGHHIDGHSLNNQGSNHEFELIADEFSGFVLARLGATLPEAQGAINSLKYEKATATHPAKADRLAAIETGWNKAMGITNNKTVEEVKEETALELYRRAERKFQARNYTEALPLFEQAREKGNVDAYYYLSLIYVHGFGTTVDEKKAYQYAETGYELGSIPATIGLANLLYWGIGIKPDEEAAQRLFSKDFQAKWFKDEFKQYKQPSFAFIIGEMYNWGIGGQEEDVETAAVWYQRGAELGDPLSMVALGEFYEDGTVSDIDEELAGEYFKRAANTGLAWAEYYLGELYYEGTVFKQDQQQAVYWHSKAAAQGVKESDYAMGNYYYQGLGVEQDLLKAADLYYKAAVQEFGDAQYALGMMYLDGVGVTQNKEQGIYWLKKALDHNQEDSKLKLIELGEISPEQEVVDISEFDTDFAVVYDKATNQRDPEAQYQLALLYENGKGVEVDKEQALFWYKKAARKGHEAAQNLLTERGLTWEKY